MVPLIIACVLRSGGPYTPEWVWALKRGLARHAPPHEFVCLTDTPDACGMWAVPLRYDWPGWWAKLALFEPGLFSGRVIYLDLDTLVVGDLTDLCGYSGPLAMLSDFYRPQLAQSGVMFWTPGPETEAIWDAWIRDPAGHMRRYRGDGEFLHAHAKPDRIQAIFPGRVASYKVHARHGPPKGARLVCAHGRPKWDDPAAGWAHDEWVKLAA